MAVTAARVFLMAASEFQAKENRAPRGLAWSSGPGFPETVSSVAAYGGGPRALGHPVSGDPAPRGATKSSTWGPIVKRAPAAVRSSRLTSCPPAPSTPAYHWRAGAPAPPPPRPRPDPSPLVPGGHLPWTALPPRRLVLDQERRHATLRVAGDREHPAELVAVRPDARQRLRVVDSPPSRTECPGVR